MARKTDPPAFTVRLIRGRDLFACAKCGAAGIPDPLTTQHRVARGMGGTTDPRVNLPSNLLTLCGSGTTGCHGWVESHPAEAKAHGWSLAWWDLSKAALLPAWTWRGWVRLRDNGDLTRLPDYTGVDGCDCGCRPVVAAGLFD